MDIKDYVDKLNKEYKVTLKINYSGRLKSYAYWNGEYVTINNHLEFTNEEKHESLITVFEQNKKGSHWLTPHEQYLVRQRVDTTIEIDSTVVDKPKKSTNVRWGCGCLDSDFFTKKGLNINLRCDMCGELVVRKDG